MTCSPSTGFGQHADYVFGWEGDSLQRAMDQCRSRDLGTPCPTLKTQSVEDINRCTQNSRVREPVDGGKRIPLSCIRRRTKLMSRSPSRASWMQPYPAWTSSGHHST
jgi:hypothetical protein